jgi:hypothetical protein
LWHGDDERGGAGGHLFDLDEWDRQPVVPLSATPVGHHRSMPARTISHGPKQAGRVPATSANEELLGSIARAPVMERLDRLAAFYSGGRKLTLYSEGGPVPPAADQSVLLEPLDVRVARSGNTLVINGTELEQ